MKITSLTLTNIRSIETAEFRFQPGFNLIAGGERCGEEHRFGCIAHLPIPNPPPDYRVSLQEDVLWCRRHT